MGIYREFLSRFKKIIKVPFVLLIKFYRYFLSPLISARCRYYPTCSQYALEALDMHGLFKGLYLSTLRILRCNPLSKRDYYDPVPQKNKVKKDET